MLTVEDYKNILQLMNRVQLQGNEAAVFVMLTHRINEEMKMLTDQQNPANQQRIREVPRPQTPANGEGQGPGLVGPDGAPVENAPAAP